MLLNSIVLKTKLHMCM